MAGREKGRREREIEEEQWIWDFEAKAVMACNSWMAISSFFRKYLLLSDNPFQNSNLQVPPIDSLPPFLPLILSYLNLLDLLLLPPPHPPPSSHALRTMSFIPES